MVRFFCRSVYAITVCAQSDLKDILSAKLYNWNTLTYQWIVIWSYTVRVWQMLLQVKVLRLIIVHNGCLTSKI